MKLDLTSFSGNIPSKASDLKCDGDFSMEQNENILSVRWAIAVGLKKIMEESNISKTDMAKRMNTSRSELDRLLDPQSSTYKSMQLSTAVKAAETIGARIELKFNRKT